jgi:transposase
LYRPDFPTEFVVQARLLSRRRTAKAHLLQRARLALLLHQQPELSNVAAALHVGLHPNSVRLWRRRWACGTFALEDRPGRGRKPTFSPP